MQESNSDSQMQESNSDSQMQESNSDSHLRTLSPRQILSWAEHHTEIMRLHTHRDVLLGGYMAAMLPALVS